MSTAKHYILYIEAEVNSELSEEELAEQVSALLTHGTIQDSFSAAELDLITIDLMKVAS